MNAAALIDRLQASAEVIGTLAGRISPELAVWKPSPDQWSILEVTAHLLDEEREDFRMRLDLTLHRPDEPWPPIDPAGWVMERAYAEKDLADTLHEFLEERATSVRWLRGLQAPAWDRAHTHPQFGSRSAGELLGAWAAHDLLHIRQLARLHFRHIQRLADPHAVDYAGTW
ncbi:MAG: DinB family protein [Candidatus Eisenbacteria bacterium]